MADTAPSQEELDLRRRARRRLVGAVALALLAVVVLPMVFDPEPRPMGDKVEIRIPDQQTPFEPTPADAPADVPVAPVTAGDMADSQGTAALPDHPVADDVVKHEKPALTEPVAKPVPAPGTKPGSDSPASKPKPVVAEKAKPQPANKPRPELKAESQAKPRPEPVKIKPQPEKPAVTPVAPKPAPSTLPTPPVKGAYYLQLGVFSSQDNARQMVARATGEGVRAVTLPMGSQFKVRVGPYADRDQAMAVQSRLKAKGINNVLVEP